MSKRSGSNPLRYVHDELMRLEEAQLLRKPPRPRDGAASLNLCSNDYLGYAASGRLRAFAEAAVAASWTGASASRLVAGEHQAHRSLERLLAAWLDTESALLFTSGYAANVGTIAALAKEGDVIVSDALNHASIIDGCRLSRARTIVVPHLDLEAVERALKHEPARRRWVITESYFSMDGDCPDLRMLRVICDQHDAALILDESHAIGIYGPEGRGLAAAAGIAPDVLVGTLGKALGGQGAFVAGSEALVAWLWNRARSFVFSTGLSPVLAGIAQGAIETARGDEVGRRQLMERSRELRKAFVALGLRVTPGSEGPIIPVLVGEAGQAIEMSRALSGLGVEVQAIRPPTVPEGSARLRVTASSLLSAADIERATAAFREVRR